MCRGFCLTSPGLYGKWSPLGLKINNLSFFYADVLFEVNPLNEVNAIEFLYISLVFVVIVLVTLVILLIILVILVVIVVIALLFFVILLKLQMCLFKPEVH